MALGRFKLSGVVPIRIALRITRRRCPGTGAGLVLFLQCPVPRTWQPMACPTLLIQPLITDTATPDEYAGLPSQRTHPLCM